MTGLPAPLSVTDEYLRAVHTELVGLRADLAATKQGGEPASGEPVALLEPKPVLPVTARTRKRT